MAKPYQLKSISRPVLYPETLQPIADAVAQQHGDEALESFVGLGLQVHLARRRDVGRIPPRLAGNPEEYQAKVASVLPSSFTGEFTRAELTAIQIRRVFGKSILFVVLAPTPTLIAEHMALNGLLRLSGISPESPHPFQFQIGLADLHAGTTLGNMDELMHVAPISVLLDKGNIDVVDVDAVD